jgi:hypothetical protein
MRAVPRTPVRGGRDSVVELASSRREAPPAPEGLSPRGCEIWAELWRSPASALWTSSDYGLGRRLVLMRERLETDATAPAALFSATLRVEQHLGLTPAAHAALGVIVSDDEPPRPRTQILTREIDGRRQLAVRRAMPAPNAVRARVPAVRTS